MSMQSSTRQRGRCVWFSNGKGYGFLEPINTAGEIVGQDVFCHFSEIQTDGFKTLTQGDIVEFELGAGPKGDEVAKLVTLL